jgi:hypothetical protein
MERILTFQTSIFISRFLPHFVTLAWHIWKKNLSMNNIKVYPWKKCAISLKNNNNWIHLGKKTAIWVQRKKFEFFTLWGGGDSPHDNKRKYQNLAH